MQNKALYATVGLIVLTLIILLSIQNFLPEAQIETREYNNYDFSQVDGNWYFDWQKGNTVYTVSLRYHPEDVENVTVRGGLLPSFNERREIYITFDPEIGENSQNFTTMTLAATELSHSIARVLGFRPISSCTYEHENCIEVPIVTCENPGNRSVIYLTDVGSAGVVLRGDCIEIRGEGFEMIRAVDRLLYQWYGIMGERWA